jgi:putative oxidoreductase
MLPTDLHLDLCVHLSIFENDLQRWRNLHMFAWLLGTDRDWVIAIARIVLGVVFFAHGAQKMLGWFGGTGLKNTVRIFQEDLHIPAPLAVLAVAAEFLGGLGLIVGFLSRVDALAIALVMCVALAVHGRFGFFMNWYGEKKGHGVEYHILVLALATLVMFKGAGALSVDEALSRHLAAQSGVAVGIDIYGGVMTQ